MEFINFDYKSAQYRIGKDCFEKASQAIISLRTDLEDYLAHNPPFLDSLVPVTPTLNPPEIALRMHRASELTGIGPMASVAGVLAQMACERAALKGCQEVVVENGGDLFVNLKEPLTIGIYAGERVLKGKLAFRLNGEDMPLAICSSSSFMGHSLSFGQCDLATVTSKNGALADSAATLAGNLVKSEDDLESTVNIILSIPGVEGVFLVKNDKIGLGGKLPQLISLNSPDIRTHITRDKSANSSYHLLPKR